MPVVAYSVNPYGTGDLKTGSPNLTISSGVATLTVSQTGNIGVGCRITYNTTSVCYISTVNSATSFNVITATGGTPSNEASPVTVNSIAHEYASLSAWEAGFIDANHLNNTDLTATGADAIPKAPCYVDQADSTKDTTNVTISAGLTMDSTHYIEFYTPKGGSESINNQRHSGTLDSTNYYTLSASNYFGAIDYQEPYFRVTGLQIEETATTSGGGSFNSAIHGYQAFSSGADVYIQYCICTRTGSFTATNNYGIYLHDGGTGWNIYVKDNLIYNFNRGLYYNNNTSDNARIYNNTVVDCVSLGMDISLFGSTDTISLRNNNVFNCVTDYSISSTATTSTITHNAYSNGADPGSSGVDTSAISGTTLFADYTNDDFHLASGATAIDDEGIGPSSDSEVNTLDIDSDTRSGTTCSIGFDEYVATGTTLQTSLMLMGVGI